MKTISFILLGAAVIHIASCVPTTTITPLGGMDMDQLVEHYKQQKFHRYDVSLPAVRVMFKSWVQKLDDFLSNPVDKQNDIEVAREVKGYLEEFLEDTTDDYYIKKCGLKQVGLYFHHLFRTASKGSNVQDMFKEFNNEYNEAFGDLEGDATYYSIMRNKSLNAEKHVKFSTACCKYFKNSIDMIDGKCY